MIIYKYLPNNKFTKELIENRNLFLNTPSNFNDPYDSFIEFRESLLSDNNSMIFRKAENEEQLEILQMIDKQPYIVNHVMTRGYIHQRFSESFLITCFSSDPINRLLWSHYAENHKGLVVGFKTKLINNELYLEVDEKNDKRFLSYEGRNYLKIYRVNYTNNLPIINTADIGKMNDANIIELLRYKDSIWEYEKEYRLIIINKNSKQVFKLAKDVIVQIFCGSKMDFDTKGTYISYLTSIYETQNRHIKLYNTQIYSDKYELLPTRNFIFGIKEDMQDFDKITFNDY